MRNKSVPEKKRSWLFGSSSASVKKSRDIKKEKNKNDKNKKDLTTTSDIVQNDNKTPSMENKKTRRFKPGTVALRDIKKAQSGAMTNSSAVSSMDKIIRDIAARMKTNVKDGDTIRFQPKALAMIREAAEAFEIDLLRLGNTLAIHRKKKMLHGEDLALASSLMLAPHVLQQDSGTNSLLGGVLSIMRRRKTGVSEPRKIESRSVENTTTSKINNLRKFTKESEYENVPDVEDDEKAEESADEFETDADDDDDIDDDNME